MRVISDFHDYYDSAQQYGQDQSIIYQRKKVDYRNKRDNSNLETAPRVLLDTYSKVFPKNDEFLFASYWAGQLYSKKGSFYYNHGRLVFCGIVYNYIVVNNIATSTATEDFFYDMESFQEFCNKKEIDLNKKSYSYHKKTKFQSINAALTSKINIDESFFIENKFICVDFCMNLITVNPQLSKMQFYKVFDSFQCFQELDSYICGKLSFPHNMMVDIEDKYRIEQHGFDKHSFRKMPTKKR